jgi:hypothetical protein
MAQEKTLKEVKELIWAIERDLEPFSRGDSMNYSGYMMENAIDLKHLIFKLLKGE